MTGMVKEEVLSRFGELGVHVRNGAIYFNPCLLREQEFLKQAGEFHYLDVTGDWQDLFLPVGSLAFSWCQVPVVYVLGESSESAVVIAWRDGTEQTCPGLSMSKADSEALFQRCGRIKQLTVSISRDRLFAAQQESKI
jgi:hypothetical protein